jgi:exosome complex RNA-binding protein Rrp42 (RNase PH superfamily)
LFSSPSASQQFEGRGADDLNNTLTLAIDRLFNGPQSGLDLEKLCIIPGQQCWILHVDAMVTAKKQQQQQKKPSKKMHVFFYRLWMQQVIY